MDQVLSAQFITAGSYGTRSTTTLWIEQDGATHWRETSFDAAGNRAAVREETFSPRAGRA
jgi:uncharacterized protein with NRDE domain